MIRRTLLLCIAALTTACGNNTEADFRLLRSDGKRAQVVDLADITTDTDGVRRVTYTAITVTPFPIPDGRLSQYGRFRYAFDCANLRYRGEGVTAYGIEFEKLDETSRRSPWRPISSPPELLSDFRRFCATKPSGDDLPRVPSGDWKGAAEAARARLEAEG